MQETVIVPQINQIELHPYFNQQNYKIIVIIMILKSLHGCH